MIRFESGINVPTLAVADRKKIVSPKTKGRTIGVYCAVRLPSGDYLPQITNLVPESRAEIAGWKIGDVITAVDGDPVRTVSELMIANNQGGSLKTFTLRRGEKIIQSKIDYQESSPSR